MGYWLTQGYWGNRSQAHRTLPQTQHVTLWAEALEHSAHLSGLPTRIDIFVGAGASNPSDFTNVNGTLFFQASDGVNGVELWKRKGTGGATTLVANIAPGAASSNPTGLRAVGTTLVLSATNGSSGFEFWTLGNGWELNHEGPARLSA
jgi:ELWxxDGT repeat protein